MPFFSFKDYRSASKRSILPPVRHHLDMDHHLVTGKNSVKGSRKRHRNGSEYFVKHPHLESLAGD